MAQSHRALPSWFADILYQSARTHLVGWDGLNKHCLWVTSSFTRAGFVFLPWPVVPHAVGWRKWSLRYLAQQSLPCYQSHLSEQCLATLSLSLFEYKLFRSWIICKSWFMKNTVKNILLDKHYQMGNWHCQVQTLKIHILNIPAFSMSFFIIFHLQLAWEFCLICFFHVAL